MDNLVPKKEQWQDRVQAVHEFHLACRAKDPFWSIRKTAKELSRSIGAVSSDIRLAEFLRSYDELAVLKNYVDALDWMRRKQIEIEKRRLHK